jgi:DNA integrity scanning protein DisA with diadenylate cyclase activity
VRAVGVGLLTTRDFDGERNHDRGMRHRSAQRWSSEHPEAVVAVVSADGPVTVYRAGAPIIGLG